MVSVNVRPLLIMYNFSSVINVDDHFYDDGSAKSHPFQNPYFEYCNHPNPHSVQ